MKSAQWIIQRSAIGVAAIALCTLAACGKASDAQNAPPAPPPTEVGVYTVQPERIAITSDLPGRLEASRIAEVRARATGIVLKRLFREGSDVKAGQLLYKIDPAPLQAAFQNAAAATQRNLATEKLASLKADRYKPLVAANAISKQDYDDAVAARDQAIADVNAAKAAETTARLNLDYADVTSPIAGRIGRELVTEGALVSAGTNTELAVVQQIDPIYVNITQSTNDALRLQDMIRQGKLQNAGANAARVKLVTDDGKAYGEYGKLLFTDLTVDPNTGAVSLRAEVPNHDHRLLPGMYVRARLEQAVAEQAIAVPQQAVIRDINGSSVFVLDADNKVASRPVTTDKAEGEKWIISDGLKAGDRVVVDGVQKIRPGATVKPVAWQPPANDATATQANSNAPKAN